jgi:hypothetical protein
VRKECFFDLGGICQIGCLRMQRSSLYYDRYGLLYILKRSSAVDTILSSLNRSVAQRMNSSLERLVSKSFSNWM